MRPGRAIAAGALTLALAGCSVGPDYRQPEVAVPAQWSEAARTDAPLARWWTTFGDPVLDSLVERAVASNLDLRVAAARVREARALRGVALSEFFPAVEGSASYERQQGSRTLSTVPPGAPKVRNLFTGGFDAGWEIDIFGGTRRAYEAAEADLDAAREAERHVLVSLLAEVARNYIEARGLQQRLEIARANIVTQQDAVEITQARFAAGLTGELDVAQARSLLARTRSQVPALESLLKQTIHRLSVLLGKEPGALQAELTEFAPIPGAGPDVPAGLPSDLVRRRPDIRLAEREVAAATARIGVATADIFPRFSLTGAFGRQAEDAGDLTLGASTFWGFGPAMRWSIFSGGRVLSEIRAADARADQALVRYEQAILAALEDVENALVAHAKERARRGTIADAVDADRRAVELAQELYTKGLTSFVNVLEAQRSLYVSQDELVQSERAVALEVVALYKALGGGWEAP